MVHVKVVAVFSYILLSVVLQLRVKSQPTINSLKDNSCSQLEEDWRIQDEENHRLEFEFEYRWQMLETLKNVSNSQSEEIQRLNIELENERQSLKTLKNVSNSQSEEIQRLNMELKNERQNLKTLKNVSISHSEENDRINMELKNKQQSLETLENAFRSHCDESQRLNMELENERRLIQNSSLRRATVKLIKRIGFDSYVYSVIKVLDEIYVLCHYPNSSNLIKVFEDRNEFRLRREIALSGTNWTYDMVYNNESKCFYIRDVNNRCIWRVTTEDDHRLTKWLTNLTFPSTLSLSIEGHLLVLRTDQLPNQLEIYSLSANLIRSIQLPYDVKNPRDVVQTSNGYYVILHKLTDALNGSMVISQVNSAGQLMNRFTPRNQFQVLNDPRKLFYDSDNNRLFVADQYNHQVILFDSNCLNWIQVLLSQETEGIWYPWNVFYNVIKWQLFVFRSKVVDIFEFI